MSEPVAWIEHHKGGDNLVWEQTRERCTPLYASSYAMGVADAARVGRDLYKGDGSRLNSYDEGWNDALDAAEQAIRALSAPPSVTLDWVRKVADGVSSEGAAVLATLAALGIEVTK